MTLTFLRNFLRCELKPSLGVIHSCSSLCTSLFREFISVPLWKYSVRRNITLACVSSRGYCTPCVRHGHHHQEHSSLLSNYNLTNVSPTDIVMRTSIKQYSSSSEKKHDSSKESEHSTQCDDPSATSERLSLFKRFKQMYRDYWYVLIPVHVVTSVGWFGAFYYMCISGVDVVAALESFNVSEKIINPLRDSKAGYLALSYAMYKIATPLRYTVTLGGTTVSINYLKKWGYIKPIPPREKLKEMYDEKKENLMERKDALIKGTTEQFKDRRKSFLKSYGKKK